MRGAPVPAGVVLLQASFLLPMALSVRKAPASHQNGHQQRDGHIDDRHLIRRRPPVRKGLPENLSHPDRLEEPCHQLVCSSMVRKGFRTKLRRLPVSC